MDPALPNMHDADPADAPHPECVVRLASAVHRFPIPHINPKPKVPLSFAKSFNSCSGGYPSTVAAIHAADNMRCDIQKCMAEEKVNHASLSEALMDYVPLINQILLSCKLQPDAARLDCKTLFSWTSGIEHPDGDKKEGKKNKKKHYDSEALMFDIVLAISSYALSESNLGCDACHVGDFPQAAQYFAKTAGAFQFLGEEMLPDWMAHVDDEQMDDLERDSPAETRAAVASAFASLYRATAQQMAVAMVLAKPEAPNYAIVGKLCLGVAQELDASLEALQSNAAVHARRMDPAFATLATYAAGVHRALGEYSLARSLWKESEYAAAIVALRGAIAAATTRATRFGKGLPPVADPKEKLQSQVFGRGLMPAAGPQLRGVIGDVAEFRVHMEELLGAWEKDNTEIYFEEIPPSVPEDKALGALLLKKSEKFILEVREPLPLEMPVTVKASSFFRRMLCFCG